MKAIRLLILLLAAVPLSMAAATWTTIDYPGALSTYVMKVNASGEMVGFYRDGSGKVHGFLWSGGTFTTIDYPGASSTYARGMNDASKIVGDYVDSHGGTYYGFLMEGQTFTQIYYPGAYHTFVSDINNAGDVVGSYYNPSKVQQSFELSGGGFTTINAPGGGDTTVEAINNLGIVTGPVCTTDRRYICPYEWWWGFLSDREGASDVVGDGANPMGFAYDGTSFLNVAYPGAIHTIPYGLNDRDEIVGYATVDPADRTFFGFLRTRGRYILLNYPGAGRTWATGIDNNGNIVGYYYGKDGYNHGFLRTR